MENKGNNKSREDVNNIIVSEKHKSHSNIIQLFNRITTLIDFEGITETGNHLTFIRLSVNAEVLKRELAYVIKEKDKSSDISTWKTIQRWLNMKNKKTKRITLIIPVETEKKNKTYVVHYRKNTGGDIRISMPSLRYSIDEAKKLKTPSNYIIYIEENGRRIKRRDREIIANSNKWRSRPIDETEIIGGLMMIYRATKSPADWRGFDDELCQTDHC